MLSYTVVEPVGNPVDYHESIAGVQGDDGTKYVQADARLPPKNLTFQNCITIVAETFGF